MLPVPDFHVNARLRQRFLHAIWMVEVYKPLDILWLNRMMNHQ